METKLLGTDRPISISYAFLTDVDSISFANSTAKSVVFKNGSTWKQINTTIGSIDLQEGQAKTGAGTVYKTMLSASSPGHE